MQALRVEQDGDLLRVTLARPERRNAFDAGLIAELTEAFDAVPEENVADARRLRKMLEAIDSCPAPVVARVHGHALGGGCGLVACSDIVVAAPDTVFAFSEVKLGIIPAVISPFALAKIGPSAARRYFVTGEPFDARTALRIGLVHEVAEDLDATVRRIVEHLRSVGPEAARHAKKLVLERPDGLGTERRIAQRRTSEEGQEGLRAFLEKRRPNWSR
jgi:methylglutaconyl-CoA hydratase